MPIVVDHLDRLVHADPSVMERDDLASAVATVARVRAWLDAFELRCTRRTRELAATGRAEPPESLLGRCGNRSSKDASTVSDRETVADAMAGFDSSLSEGTVSGGHLDAIANATRRLDADLRAEFATHEPELLEHARTESVDVFARRCRDLARRLIAANTTNDAEELDRQRSRSNIRRWVDQLDGMHHTHITLDPVRDATLRGALEHATARRRQVDGNANTPWDQLQVDALIDAVSGGTITEHPTTCTCAGTGTGAPTAGDVADQLRTTLDHLTNGNTDDTEPVDVDDADEAGVDHPPVDDPTAVNRMLRQIDARLPEINVLIDLDTLLHGLHDQSICETDNGTPLPVSTIRRLCCDADIIPIVLNGDGIPLDVGRTKRTATPTQRRALRAIHRTCAGPDCTIPFSQTHAHHIHWWHRDTGPTDIDNLLPLCQRCHHLVHETGWTVTLTSNRTITWTRPDGTTHTTTPTPTRKPARARARRAA